MSHALLVALQYCGSDAAHCHELAELLVQLAPDNPGIGLLFWHANDASPPSADLVSRLEAYYPVFVHDSPAVATGWPDGPNEHWQYLAKALLDPGFCPGFGHVLTAEPDSVPLQLRWAQPLLDAHVAAVARGAVVTGHVCAAPGPHINGNLIMRRDAAAVLPELLLRRPHGKAWDYDNRELLLARGEDNPWLMSDYKCHRKDSIQLWSQIKACGQCTWLHGPKGWHGLDEAWRRLLPNKRPRHIPQVLHQIDLSDTPEYTAMAEVRAVLGASGQWEYHVWGRELLETSDAQEQALAAAQDWPQLHKLLAMRVLNKHGGWYVASGTRLALPLSSNLLPGAGFVATRRGDAASTHVMGAVQGAAGEMVGAPHIEDALDKARGVAWLPACVAVQPPAVPERVAAAEIPRYVCVARDRNGGWTALGAALSKHPLIQLAADHLEMNGRRAEIMRVVRLI